MKLWMIVGRICVREMLTRQLLAIAGTGGLPQPQEGNGDMPGAFPGDAGGRDE